MQGLRRVAPVAGVSLVVAWSALGARAYAADPTFKSEPEVKPKAPGEKIKFQLEDAEISELVRVVSGMTGKRFVIANAKIKALRATVVSSQPITVGEAYQAFLSVLQNNGLTVLDRGTFYQIVESKDVERQNTAIVHTGAVTAEDRYVTQIHRLQNVRAEDIVENLLAKFQSRDGTIVPYAPGNLLIMTDTGANLRRLMQLLEEIDVPAASEDKLYFEPIHYASSADVEKRLTEIFDLKKKSAPSGELHVTKVLAIERPNALAIVASPESYKRLLSIVRLLDQPMTNEGQVNIIPLQHADAKKLVGPLNEALTGAAPAASSGGGGGAGGSPSGSGSAPSSSGAGARLPLTVLESAVKISAEETSNSILVTSSPRDFAAIKTVIDQLDRPKRQVYIEAVVMEISASRGLNLGVSWHGGATDNGGLLFGGFNAKGSALPPDSNALQAFALGIRAPEIPLPFSIPTGASSSISSIPSLGAFITAAAAADGTDILSTPSIVASDNTAAELKVQLNTPLNPNAPPSPIFAGGVQVGAQAPSANMQKIGPRIKITPHLNDSDEIRLDVDEQISDIDKMPDASNPYGAVTFLERSANTTLTVKDEETVVIAGLVRNMTTRHESKVPILGDIPVLGFLFRQTQESTEKRNLVLVLTPHIMRDKADRVRIFERKMEERQRMVDEAALFGGQSWEPPRDYAHSRGILGEIHKQHRRVEQQRALERQRDARETLDHEPQAPVDPPVPIQTWGASDAPSGRPAPSSPGK